MDLDFIRAGLVARKKAGAPSKDKEPDQPIWDRFLKTSQETITESIAEWDGYINKPDERNESYYASKNWTITNRKEFLDGKPAEVRCSMTVGATQKFNILPDLVKDSEGNIALRTTKDGKPSSKKVGSVMQTQENVMSTLKGFQNILENLKKDTVLGDGTEAGKIFWKTAGTIAQPKGKSASKHKYDKATDTFIKKD